MMRRVSVSLKRGGFDDETARASVSYDRLHAESRTYSTARRNKRGNVLDREGSRRSGVGRELLGDAV